MDAGLTVNDIGQAIREMLDVDDKDAKTKREIARENDCSIGTVNSWMEKWERAGYIIDTIMVTRMNRLGNPQQVPAYKFKKMSDEN